MDYLGLCVKLNDTVMSVKLKQTVERAKAHYNLDNKIRGYALTGIDFLYYDNVLIGLSDDSNKVMDVCEEVCELWIGPLFLKCVSMDVMNAVKITSHFSLLKLR